MKRAVFPPGQQSLFLLECQKHLNETWPDLASAVHVHPRTLSDWRREKSRVPQGALQLIAYRAGKTIPKVVTYVGAYAHTARAGRKGAQAVMKKFGRVPVNERERLLSWRSWWQREGRYITWQHSQPQIIRTPARSKRLAEFIGIMLGDGGMSKYQLTVSLNRITDADYSRFVIGLMKELFGATVSVSETRRALVRTMYVSSIRAVAFCQRNGLTVGDKIRNGAAPPSWITASLSYSAVCLRGMVDTDGSFFAERHVIRGRMYEYRRMHFVSASSKLRLFAFETLSRLGFHPRLRNRHVTLEKPDEVVRYLRVVGTSNPKHLARSLEGWQSLG